MTKVCPIARIAIMEPWRSKLEMLLPVAKLGVAMLRATQRRTSSPTRVSANRKFQLRRVLTEVGITSVVIIVSKQAG
jgi:hypothetical protein